MENSETIESDDESCGCISHKAWKESGPFYTIILYPDFSYKVCTCTDNFPHEPNLTNDGYSCIDWDFYNEFWVSDGIEMGENGKPFGAKYGMDFVYTDYYNPIHCHKIFPIRHLSRSFGSIKKRIGRLLKKGKFHREKNRNILAEYIGFDYRKDPWQENNFSEITDISEMPKIYGPVLIHSNSCWRTMSLKTCEKAIELINNAIKKYINEKYITHLKTCN
jgi:hypothetical protein